MVLESPIPWLDGDKVRVVGATVDGAIVPTQKMKDGEGGRIHYWRGHQGGGPVSLKLDTEVIGCYATG